MTDLEERIKKVLDEECTKEHKGNFKYIDCSYDLNSTLDYRQARKCYICHKNDTLAVRLAEEVRTK